MKLALGQLVTVSEKAPLLTYKKLELSMKSPIYKFHYDLGKMYKNAHFDSNLSQLQTRRFYSILPQYLKEHLYSVALRFFSCQAWGKVVVEPYGSIGSEYIRLNRELSLQEALPFFTSEEAY